MTTKKKRQKIKFSFQNEEKKTIRFLSLVLGKIIPNSPADQCGQLHVNDRILAVNNVDLTHMPHTDVVNLIKDSGRTITLKIGPPMPTGKEKFHRLIFYPFFFFRSDDRSQERLNPFSNMSNNHLSNNLSNGIRPSSSSPMVIANGNHHPSTMTTNLPHSMTNGTQSIRNAISQNPINPMERYFDHSVFF